MSRLTRAMMPDQESLAVYKSWVQDNYGRDYLAGELDDTFRYPTRADGWKRFAWLADDAGYGAVLLHYVYASARRDEGEKDRLPALPERKRNLLETAMGLNPYQWIERAMYEQLQNASKAQIFEYLVQAR